MKKIAVLILLTGIMCAGCSTMNTAAAPADQQATPVQPSVTASQPAAAPAPVVDQPAAAPAATPAVTAAPAEQTAATPAPATTDAPAK